MAVVGWEAAGTPHPTESGRPVRHPKAGAANRTAADRTAANPTGDRSRKRADRRSVDPPIADQRSGRCHRENAVRRAVRPARRS
ncbi:hypothetical protein NFA_28880 [Nocardia farcinica IFM 10152]|uniref:Uncharacterized protein n=1 Tax=Nocardia farcinica (strain IFM 10152) TaxID=247156 RepID=Q5YVQ6_NOCFA|nr:hypothetical protein NFA_28880 [Nocardia farcinica IFM 10152]